MVAHTELQPIIHACVMIDTLQAIVSVGQKLLIVGRALVAASKHTKRLAIVHNCLQTVRNGRETKASIDNDDDGAGDEGGGPVPDLHPLGWWQHRLVTCLTCAVHPDEDNGRQYKGCEGTGDGAHEGVNGTCKAMARRSAGGEEACLRR